MLGRGAGGGGVRSLSAQSRLEAGLRMRDWRAGVPEEMRGGWGGGEGEERSGKGEGEEGARARWRGEARRPGFPCRSLAASSVLTALQSKQTAGEGAASDQVWGETPQGPLPLLLRAPGSRGLETREPESAPELPRGTETAW